MAQWNSAIRCGLALILLASTTATAQNLLLNPGFEEGSGYPPSHWTVTPDLNKWIEWKESWFWGAYPHLGNKFMVAGSASNYNAGTIEQSIGLPDGPGEYDLVLSFWSWLFSNNTSVASYVKGEILVDGNPVASQTVSAKGSGTTDWTERIVRATGVTANTDISVRITLRGDGTAPEWWGLASVDDVSLGIDLPCTTPGTFNSPVSPNAFTFPPALGTTETVVIDGTNLDQVTHIVMTHESGLPKMEGDITAQSATQITAEFDMSGLSVGYYDLMGFHDNVNCADPVLPDAIRIVNIGPDLLLNTSFEDDNIRPTDWPEHWVDREDLTDPGDQSHWVTEDYFSLVPRTGTHAIGASDDGTSKTCIVEQSAGVPYDIPGWYTLNLSFWATIKDIGGIRDSVTADLIVDGVVVDPGYPVSNTINSTANSTKPYTQGTITWTGMVSSSIVVRLTMIANQTSGGFGAIVVDDVTLGLTPACGEDQHELTGITSPDPAVQSNDDDVDNVIIAGNNLELVDSVYLAKRITDGENMSYYPDDGIIVGDNIVATASSVTVDFPTRGKDAGLYDVVVEQPGCAPRALMAAFEVSQANHSDNLLLNPSFEAPALGDNQKSNDQLWFGQYGYDTIHTPTPAFIDGSNRLAFAHSGNEVDWTWQTVQLPLGEHIVNFIGYVSVGTDPDVSKNEVRLRLYERATGNGYAGPNQDALNDSYLVAEAFINKNTPRLGTSDPNNTWTLVEMTAKCHGGEVTLEIKSDLIPQGAHLPAVHMDAFGLYTTDDCTNPHTLDPPETPNPDPYVLVQNEDPSITITGTSMDRITGVKLVRLESGAFHETVIEGTINSQDAASVVANFITTGTELGMYNLVTEQAGTCSSQVIIDAVQVTPAVGTDLIANGNFDTCVLDPVYDWILATGTATGDIHSSEIQSWFGITAHSPHCFVGDATDGGNGQGGNIIQHVVEGPEDLPTGYGDYSLTLQFWVYMYDPDNWYAGSVYPNEGTHVRAEIIVDGSTVSELLIDKDVWGGGAGGGDPERPWTQEYLGYSGPIANSVDVRLSWGVVNPEGGFAKIAIDDVELIIPASGCNRPFADADGDADVDQEDFSVFQLCYTGDVVTAPLDEVCRCFDRMPRPNRDDKINQADVSEFEKCATGPDVILDPDDETTWPGYGTIDACEGAGYEP